MPFGFPRVIVRLIGGLGNQLFQFAKMWNLIEMTGEKDVAFDVSYYSNCKKAHEVISLRSLFEGYKFVNLGGLFWKFSRNLARALNKVKMNYFPFHGVRFIFEGREFSSVKGKLRYVFDGFWQDQKEVSPAAIERIKLALEREFDMKDQACQYYLGQILNSESVCVHVRRGDYLTNRNWRGKLQDVLPEKFYDESIEIMRSKGIADKFFLFSDDDEWLKSHFSTARGQFVIVNNRLGIVETLYLMTKCKNFIIANSTFSWWASTLATNPMKVIIAPNPWQKKSACDSLLGDRFHLVKW